MLATKENIMRYAPFLGLLFSTLALIGCQQNPATGQQQFIVLSAQQVNAMGAAAKPELIQEYGGEVPSSTLRAYVDDVGMKLLTHVEPEFQDLEWDFIVLDSDIINAFALPGGNVFISRGLMAQFENEAQLAGVLGHEIGHVTGRHIDERISKALALEGALIGIGIASDSDLAQYSQVIVGVGGQGYLLSFGRGQETQADTLGMRYMTRAGYDPHAMLEVMDVLKAASAGAQPPEFLSTHPHPDTRIRQITSAIAGEYAHTQNNPEYVKNRSRYQQIAVPELNRLAGTVNPVADALLAAFSRHHGCCHHHEH